MELFRRSDFPIIYKYGKITFWSLKEVKWRRNLVRQRRPHGVQKIFGPFLHSTRYLREILQKKQDLLVDFCSAKNQPEICEKRFVSSRKTLKYVKAISKY
jgi:hypothetical protein